jgi:YqaJ-like viral recombinase domain
MTITYHPEVEQGSEEWKNLRRGILCASEVKHILTPTLKVANNDKTRAHVWEIAAQRISGYTEPTYIGDAMLRGHEDELKARALYSERYAPVTEVGFITNDDLGFMIGYSPDGLVGDDGLTECKSRIQKYQVQTIVENTPPDEFMLQLQTGLFVTRRKWIDFISYSGGLYMVTMRVEPIAEYQAAIRDAAIEFEAKVAAVVQTYNERQNDPSMRLIPTERTIEEEMFIGETE